MPLHPCQTCGACCASFRVAFHWSEAALEAGGAVPAELTEVLDAHRLVMRGTYAGAIRCVALRGAPGGPTQCAIYPQRPSPCRDLAASWEQGEPSPQCDRARARHGLAPLTPADWRGAPA